MCIDNMLLQKQVILIILLDTNFMCIPTFFLDMDATATNKPTCMGQKQEQITPSSFSRLGKEKKLKKYMDRLVLVNIFIMWFKKSVWQHIFTSIIFC